MELLLRFWLGSWRPLLLDFKFGIARRWFQTHQSVAAMPLVMPLHPVSWDAPFQILHLICVRCVVMLPKGPYVVGHCLSALVARPPAWSFRSTMAVSFRSTMRNSRATTVISITTVTRVTTTVTTTVT